MLASTFISYYLNYLVLYILVVFSFINCVVLQTNLFIRHGVCQIQAYGVQAVILHKLSRSGIGDLLFWIFKDVKRIFSDDRNVS